MIEEDKLGAALRPIKDHLYGGACHRGDCYTSSLPWRSLPLSLALPPPHSLSLCVRRAPLRALRSSLIKKILQGKTLREEQCEALQRTTETGLPRKEWHEEIFKVDKLTALTSLKLARCNNITDGTALWMHDLAIPGKDNRPK